MKPGMEEIWGFEDLGIWEFVYAAMNPISTILQADQHVNILSLHQILKSANSQILKFPNPQIPKFTNFQILPPMFSPSLVVDHMMQHDLFSQWLGIEVLEIKEGYSRIRMQIRKEMLNGLGIVHGGIAFSLADSAFAFACNNRNNLSVALDTSINFLKPVHVGDTLTAEATEIHNGRSTGLYHIEIRNQEEVKVAIFKGTCFRTNKEVVKR